jgi:glutathione peroxidase
MASFYDFSIPRIDGAADLLGPWRGHVALAVNVASRCGYTPQYAGLEQLYRELAGHRFVVFGFPCNQFGAQEPEADAGIAQFCATRYGVTFPMSTKIDVNGAGRHPLYCWLTAPESGAPGDIEWNFEKFLIDRAGRIVRRYPSGTTPYDSGLLQDIADVL